MKVLFDAWRPKTMLPFLACVATAAAGCGKADTSAPATPPSQTPVATAPAAPTSTSPAPAPSPQPLVQTVSTNSVGPTPLQSLNRAMIRWMRTNHRRPRDFQEFASTANVQIPDPPPGKKYALNGRGFIVLVDTSTQ